MRSWTIVVSMCLLVFAGPAWADFCMLTQNALRLGHGGPDAVEAKREVLRAIFKDYAVVVVQEVMDPAEPERLASGSGFTAWVSGPRGRSSYVEHYAFLTRGDAVTVLDHADYPDAEDAFARKPFGIAVEDEAGAYWIVGFHAIFGRQGKAPRRAEVAAMAQVLAWFAARDVPGAGTIDRVVVAGDWNLAAADGAFATLAEAVEGLRAAPDLKTSLNAEGILTSPYDHFLWNSRVMNVDLAEEPRDSGGLTLPDYRSRVSDHVGVAGWIAADPEGRRPETTSCPPDRAPLVAVASFETVPAGPPQDKDAK